MPKTYNLEKKQAENRENEVFTQVVITVYSHMKLMYRKHVQTILTKAGIWLWEFVSIAFSK